MPDCSRLRPTPFAVLLLVAAAGGVRAAKPDENPPAFAEVCFNDFDDSKPYPSADGEGTPRR
jgi:hypothetical protein